MGSDFTAHNTYHTKCSLHKLKKYKNTIFLMTDKNEFYEFKTEILFKKIIQNICPGRGGVNACSLFLINYLFGIALFLVTYLCS